jgi:hypothetical protein
MTLTFFCCCETACVRSAWHRMSLRKPSHSGGDCFATAAPAAWAVGKGLERMPEPLRCTLLDAASDARSGCSPPSALP